jgi:choline dehydrogenase-like flavoprotein
VFVTDLTALTVLQREPDVLVVGAGAVGIVLSLALARAGLQVVLLEAGPHDPDQDFRRRNAGPSTGRSYRGLLDGRMKALGGTTHLWGMKALGGTTRLWGGQLTPFSRADFVRRLDTGAEADGSTGSSEEAGWPIDYDDIAPYIARAASFLGLTTSHVPGITEASCLEFGADLAISHHILLRTPNFVSLFGRELAECERLWVATDLELRALRFAGDRVCTATARSTFGVTANFTPRHVVLANGTLELVRILLRAAATDPACPFRHNHHLGRGFIDHLHGVAGRVREADRQRLRGLFETQIRGGVKVITKVRASDAFILRDGNVNCAATIISAGTLRQYAGETMALLKRVFQNPSGGNAFEAARHCAAMGRILLPLVWSYLVEKRAYTLFSDEILIRVEIEQLPTAASYLSLDADQAPEDAPIGVHWSVDGREIRALRAFCQALAVFLEESGLGRVELDPRIVDGDPAFFDGCHDAYHQMGGARMARDPERGVVSPELRVFGTRNLWGCGGAVFPSGSFANPTLLAMALAHRLSEQLAREVTRAEAVTL